MRRITTILLLTLLLCTQSWAQQKIISGKVTDSEGRPIASATVLVKGTTTGTSTQVDGKFELTLPANAKTLIISAVGYADFDVPIGAKTIFDSSTSELTTKNCKMLWLSPMESKRRSP
jgi:hypothetical protein